MRPRGSVVDDEHGKREVLHGQAVESKTLTSSGTAAREPRSHVAELGHVVRPERTRFDGARGVAVVACLSQRALVEYRDDVATQRMLGMADWKAGLKAREEAIETAQATKEGAYR